MVKAYLRYVRQEAFGLVASPSGNVSFFTCPSPAVSSSLSNDGLSLGSSGASATATVVERTALQAQQQYVVTCSGSAVLLWHFAQQIPLLYFSPFPSPFVAYSAAAIAATSCPYHATCLALSVGNKFLAVGYSDGSVRVWECPTAAALAAATSAASATAAVCTIDSPAAAAAASALYPPALLTFHGHRSAVTTLAWGSAGEDALVGDTHLASGAGDGDVIVWDRLSGAGVCRLHAHSAPVSAVLLLLSRSQSVAGGGAFTAWEDGRSAALGREAVLGASAGLEQQMAAARIVEERRGGDGTTLLLLSGGKDGAVKIWDVNLQLCLQALDAAAAGAAGGAHALAAGGGHGEVWSLAVDKAQSRLLVGCADHVIRVYKLHRRIVSNSGPAEDPAGEEKEEQMPAAPEKAAAVAAAAASMGVSVDVVKGLPLFATFFGLLQRQAAGGNNSSKRRTTCMQFVRLSDTPAAGEATGNAPGAGTGEEDSLLIVCSGGSRSIEVYRVCGPREMRKRMRRRQKRQIEKMKKKNQLIKKQKTDNQEEEKEEEEAVSVTDQFVFLYRLHTKSIVKSFGARARWRGWAAATAAHMPDALLSTGVGGGGGVERKRRRKAEQKRQEQQQKALQRLEQKHHHVAGQHQRRGANPEVDIVLGLADNAVELWQVEAERVAEDVSKPTGPANLIDAEGGAAGDAPAGKQHRSQQEAAAPAQLIRSLATAGHRGTIRRLAVSHDSSLLLSLADEGLKVWTVHSRKCVKTVPLDFPLTGFFVAGNEHVLVGTRGGDLLLVNLGDCGVQQQPAAHANPVHALAENPKHTGFCSVSADKVVKFFDFYVERPKPVASTSSSAVPATLRKQKKRARDTGLHSENPSTHRPATTAANSGNADTLVSEQEAKVESLTGGSSILFRQVGSTELPDAGVDVQYTMNGKYVACALQDMTILLLYADSKKMFLSLYGHQLPIYSISISSDSTLLASGSGDKTVKIWNVDFGNIQQSLLAHEQAVTQTHYLLSASLDASVKLWDIDKRHCLVSVFSSVCNSPVTSLVATGDGDMVFAAHKSRLIQCWRRSQEQLFVEEEQQRRWEEAADRQALREDALVGATAVSTQVVLDRTTKRTIEALRSTERLMEVLDEAREQQELDTAHARALSVWKEQRLKSGGGELPRPIPPPPKPELVGRTATEHVLRMLGALRSSDALEVLVALPFDYAHRLLDFIVAHLSTYGALSARVQHEQQQETRRVLEAAAAANSFRRKGASRSEEADFSSGRECKKEGSRKSAENVQADVETSGGHLQIFLCPIETAARVAVILVQLHFKVFLASPSLRPLLANLRSCLRPLLLQERDRLRFNSAACAFVERCLALEHVSYSSRAYNDNRPGRKIRG